MHAQAVDYMQLAMPIYLVAVLVEWFLSWAFKKDKYHLGTAMSDMACGTVFRVLEVFFNTVLYAVYAWVFTHWTLISFDEGSPWPWVIGMVGVDLMFYWWHRASHVVNVLWAVHGVHHQSEDYNLAVALRQPAFEPITWFLFYIPLALLGVPPEVYLVAYFVNRFYQFWIHTELVGKMGPLVEWLFNTPSHHRAHHGVQAQYLDKNYGAILIVWDRLFGTFEPEVERVQYGTTVPLGSYDPVWANLQYFFWMASLSQRAKSRGERIWAWLAHPEWLPAGVPEPAKPLRDTSFRKHLGKATSAVHLYVFAQFMTFVVLFGAYTEAEHSLSWATLLVGTAAAILAQVAFCALCDGQRWALRVERARLWLAVPTALIAGWTVGGMWVGLALGALLALWALGSAWLCKLALGNASVRA